MREVEELSAEIASAKAALVASGVVERVTPNGADERLWLDLDLASLAEHRLGDTTDPRTLGDARREDWLARATWERPWSIAGRSMLETCYFLLEGGERVGTLAISTSTRGGRLVRLARRRPERVAWYADAGVPEALARRIERWEAWDAEHGYRFATPRIPGVRYRSWSELETAAD